MKQRHGSAISALMSGLSLFAAACAPAPEPRLEPEVRAARLARIENDLEPAVVIRGVKRSPVGLAERMEELGIPALSVAMWSGGEMVWERAWGLADVESGRAATPDTLFQAASISKPVAAMGLLTLVDEGLVDLDRDINDFLISWKVPGNALTAKTPVTLRGLLSHTAGITVHGFPGYPREAEIPTTLGVLDGEGNTDAVRVDLEPRTKSRYSGGGFTIAQLLAADVSKRPFADLLRDRVLVPLGMDASTYEQPLPESRWGRAATAYRADGSAVPGGWHVYPEMAAAGLWTTAGDLARFAMSIQRARDGGEHPVLSRERLDDMLTRQIGGFGLGPRLIDGGSFFGHGGGNAGFRCSLVAELDGASGIAMMTNSDRGSVLNRELLYSVAREEGWDAFKPSVKRVVDLAPQRVAGLVGRFSTQGPPGTLTVVLQKGEIWAHSDWDGDSVRLLAESENRIFAPLDGMTVEIEWNGDTATALEIGTLEFRRVE